MRVFCALILFVLCLPVQVMAQGVVQTTLNQEPAPAVAIDVIDDDDVDVKTREQLPEEIMVTGERFIYQLRSRMMAAEEKAYDIFNQFNDEKRFSIRCSMHQPTGTRIERQVCQPHFEAEATASHGQAYMNNYRDNNMDTHIPLGMQIASQQQAYKSKIREIAHQHPEFLNAVIEYSELRQQFESAAKAEKN